MTGPVHHTGWAAGTSVAAALVDEEMARLAASDVLRRAPSHRRLLQYLVDRRLADDATALREPAIAFEVFRRDPATFDAQADPIVRVTVGRLRARLDAHYAHCRPVPRLRIRRSASRCKACATSPATARSTAPASRSPTRLPIASRAPVCRA